MKQLKMFRILIESMFNLKLSLYACEEPAPIFFSNFKKKNFSFSLNLDDKHPLVFVRLLINSHLLVCAPFLQF